MHIAALRVLPSSQGPLKARLIQKIVKGDSQSLVRSSIRQRAPHSSLQQCLKAAQGCHNDLQDAMWMPGMVEDVSHQYGENLFGICCLLPEESSYFNVSDAVISWYSELSGYNFNNPGYSLDTGHFTQVTALSKAECPLAKQQYTCVCQSWIVSEYTPEACLKPAYCSREG